MTGRPLYDTSERNGRYVLIETNPEDDAIQINTAGELSDENIEPTIRRSNRNVNNPKRYGSVPDTGNFRG